MAKRIKFKNWSQDDMNSALRRIKNGELSMRSAARCYQIPSSTLHDKLVLKRPVVSKQGPNPYLTRAEEEAIAKWTVQMDRLGLSQTKVDIQNVVKKMLDKDGRPSPFPDNRPGVNWFHNFKQRNPEVIVRRPQSLSKYVTVVTPAIIDKWFKDFAQYLEEIKAQSILCEPARLYKCEESGFQLGGKAGSRVFKGKVPKRKRTVINSDNSKITVVATVSAKGHFPPPLIVLPSKKAQASRTCKEGALEGAAFAGTQNGVMDPGAFLVFLTNVFQPFLIQNRVPLPVLLFVNEQSKYQSLEVTEFCTKNSILLYQAPPHAASAPRVSSISVAGSIDVEWDFVEKAYRKSHPRSHVTETNFPAVFCDAWERVIAKPSVGVDGFKAVGIYPFTKMHNLTKWMTSSASTSKESWPPNSNFATVVEDPGYPYLKDGIEAGGSMLPTSAPVASSSLSTSATAPHSSLSAGGDTTAGVPARSLETAPDRTVTLPGLAPVQVSSTAAMLLSKVVGVLEKNGSITFQLNKNSQEKVVSQTQESGVHCSTCRCSIEEQHQVPKELWEEFQLFQREKRKCQTREQMEQNGERKGKKRQRADELREEETVERKSTRTGRKKRETPRVEGHKEVEGDAEGAVEDIDESICIECGQREKGEEEDEWIGCNFCNRWLHLECSELCGLSAEEIASSLYKCDYCQ